MRGPDRREDRQRIHEGTDQYDEEEDRVALWEYLSLLNVLECGLQDHRGCYHA